MWDKFKKPIAAAVVAVIVLPAAYYVLVYEKGRGMRDSAKRFVDRAVPEVIQDWSVSRLRSYSAPELMQNNPDNERIFVELNEKLGTMKKFNGSRYKGGGTMPLSGKNSTVFFLFNVQAEFENGDASLDVGVALMDGGWRIANFFVQKAK